MATLQDIGVAAGINLLSALVFLLAFAILRLQPINDRVYFPKWYLMGSRDSPKHVGTSIGKFINLDWRTYHKFLNWIPEAVKMPESALIEHAGLDSVVYLRIYIVGLKIFVPLMILAFTILVPVNVTSGISDAVKNEVGFSIIDKVSISNVSDGSERFWSHVLVTYVFAVWTCYVLYMEYEMIASMRLRFLEAQHRRPDQFTVLVRNVPADPDESISEHIEHFFCVNHPEHYLTHQVVYNANKLAKLVKHKEIQENWLDYNQNKYVRNPKHRPTMKKGFLGLWGAQVDSIDYYKAKIDALVKDILLLHYDGVKWLHSDFWFTYPIVNSSTPPVWVNWQIWIAALISSLSLQLYDYCDIWSRLHSNIRLSLSVLDSSMPSCFPSMPPWEEGKEEAGFLLNTFASCVGLYQKLMKLLKRLMWDPGDCYCLRASNLQAGRIVMSNLDILTCRRMWKIAWIILAGPGTTRAIKESFKLVFFSPSPGWPRRRRVLGRMNHI